MQSLIDVLENLDFADDVCLLLHSFGDTQRKKNNLSKKRANMEIIVIKTKIVQQEKLQICNRPLEDIKQDKESQQRFCPTVSNMKINQYIKIQQIEDI